MRQFIILCAALATVGCTTRLTHEAFNDEKAITDAGIVYALPRQKISVDYSYILTACHDHLANRPDWADTPRGAFTFRRTAKVTISTEADWSKRFLIPYEKLQRGNKATTFNAALYDNGTLKSVGAKFDDRTAEIAGNVIKTAASVAKMGLGFTGPLDELKQTCTDDAVLALRRVHDLKERLASADPLLSDKERASAESALQRNLAALTITKKAGLLPQANSPATLYAQKTLDETAFEKLVTADAFARIDENEKNQTFQTTICLAPGLGVDRVSDEPSYCGKIVKPDDRAQTIKKPSHGVVYRDPLLVTVIVCKGDCIDGKKMAVTPGYIAQLGPERRLTLVSRPFQDANISASFAPDGRMLTIAHGSSAALEAASGILAEAAGQAQANLSAFKGRETAAAKAEFEQYKAQADAIEQRRRLEKLQAEEAAAGDADE